MDFKSLGLGTPSHSHLDSAAYFITAATYRHQRLLGPESKVHLRELLQRVFADYGWRLEHWVILDNHYHLLATSHAGRDLPRIINKVHNLSAQEINRQRAHERVWCNYWDYCPRHERDYQVRLCYLLNNPCKHGYVQNLHDWPWSSFATLYGEREEDGMRRLFREYREYRDLELPEDDC